MEIKIRGFDNNRPVLETYNIADKSVAEATASKIELWFDIRNDLDQRSKYALLDKNGKFFGMLMFVDKTRQAMLTTFPTSNTKWKPGTLFRVHKAKKVSSKLDY